MKALLSKIKKGMSVKELHELIDRIDAGLC